MAAAGLLPAAVGGLEMHGTGTALGDPIEMGAAVAALPGTQLPLRFTAAKSVVGHAEPAAGARSDVRCSLHALLDTGP